MSNVCTVACLALHHWTWPGLMQAPIPRSMVCGVAWVRPVIQGQHTLGIWHGGRVHMLPALGCGCCVACPTCLHMQFVPWCVQPVPGFVCHRRMVPTPVHPCRPVMCLLMHHLCLPVCCVLVQAEVLQLHRCPRMKMHCHQQVSGCYIGA